ncbi:hypothetical protein AGR8A_Cc50069 [Agrobacterium fabrum str. J-07]|nr:hypothetical protein AGR8A_Cc50069 [Agrobacterium fabrum str. J-07]
MAHRTIAAHVAGRKLNLGLIRFRFSLEI